MCNWGFFRGRIIHKFWTKCILYENRENIFYRNSKCWREIVSNFVAVVGGVVNF